MPWFEPAPNTHHAIDAVLVARKLCHLLGALPVQVVEVPDTHTGRVSALPGGQVPAIGAEGDASDRLARRVQNVALPVFAGVEQHYRASAKTTEKKVNTKFK